MIHSGVYIAYIIDPDTGEFVSFDGVLKIQHNISLKIDEEEDKKHAGRYVNHALNEPDEVVMDVMMSNVHDGSNGQPDTTDRARNLYERLLRYKRERRLLTLVTLYAAYGSMLIRSISMLQDDTTQNGWSATITLQEGKASGGAAPKQQKRRPPAKDKGNTELRPTPALSVSYFGANAIPSAR